MHRSKITSFDHHVGEQLHLGGDSLPDSFGGTSGGGLWRVHTRKRDDWSFEAVHHRLIGIASREDKGSPPRITCQGMGRVEAMLEGVRRRMGGAASVGG